MKCSTIVSVALVLPPCCAMAQKLPARNLAELVESLHWDPAKRGALMVLEPERVAGKEGVDGLAAFHRTRTTVTGLSAIIPDSMVIIDDSLQQSPNMYDGLPRPTKVLYLMSTLDSRQWEAITGGGLGMSDLTGDQKGVFTSILPKPFKYSTYKVGNKYEPEPLETNLELSDTELQSVRLRLERSLQFMMPIIGQQDSMTPRDTNQDHGKPGDKFIERDSDADFRKQDSFGIKVRQTVPNMQKPSDLDYRATNLNGSIQLNPSERISDMLKRIGQVTGLELHADLRVGDRMMVCYGRSTPISSALRVIALSVTGTYRKVGPAYILTSDLVGMGARKMKLAAFDSELNAKVWNEESAWRQQIYKSGHLIQVRFRADDHLTPSDSLAKKLDQGPPGSRTKINSSDLSEGLKKFIERQNETYKNQQVTADGAEAQSDYEFSYVLPSGDSTRPDLHTLGQHELFSYSNTDPRPSQDAPSQAKLAVTAIKDPVYLCLSADTVAGARHAVALASRYGFKDLWLHTLSSDSLIAALKDAAAAEIKVSLAVCPFDYEGAADAASADRTLFGDTPPQSLERRKADSDWAQIQTRGWGEPEPLGSISPLSTGYQARQNMAISLAKTPGLAGVRVLNSTPHGYNGPRVNYTSIPRPIYLEKGNFGYAEDLRLAFMRLQNVDPIDLCPPNIYTNSDLRQPFFLDDLLRGGTSIYDGRDQPNPAIKGMMASFDSWLADLNHSCLRLLLESIAAANPQLPILVDAIPVATNAINRPTGGLVSWKSGDPLPEILETEYAPQPVLGKYVVRAWVSDSGVDYARAALRFIAQGAGNRQRFAGVVLDLSPMADSKVERWMKETFLLAPIR